ncbi:MAG: hypothetical protein RR654_11040, partial [Oscillospiraceae bacterium]
PRFIKSANATIKRAIADLEKEESRLVQKNLNCKNAKRHLVQLVNTNFDKSSIHISLTYNNKFLPKTQESADKYLDLWLRKIKRECKKQNLPNPQYIGVTEYQEKDDSKKQKFVRFHHHVILNCKLSRDELEALWKTGRGKNAQSLGMTNADRLQPDNNSLEALCNYITKYPNRKKRWRQSRGLKQPLHKRPNDSKYSHRYIENLCRNGLVNDKEIWRNLYPGWILNDVKPVYSDFTGWSIYAKLRKLT